MKLIAHRGNTTGPKPHLENNPNYLLDALNSGFDIELDIWWWNEKFYLGHDAPYWELKSEYLLADERSWCHAKNNKALEMLLKLGYHCFWHQNDDFTLTSKNYIWTYPNKELISKNLSVCVVNEIDIDKQTFNSLQDNCVAICSDYTVNLKNWLTARNF